MVSFSLEFDTELDIRETTRRLLTVHGVTGEIGCHRLQNGRWRLDVMSERELQEGLVDSLKGRKTAQPADGSGQ
jgi:hypothetical protein